MDMDYYNLTGHFNLRTPKVNKPVTLYFVVGLSGKQYKFSTGLKVYPYQWDKRHNMAIISNQFSGHDNKNNELVNRKITEITNLFSEFKLYLCSQEIINHNIVQELKTILQGDMKSKEISTVRMIEFALDYYYRVIHPETKDSSVQQEMSKLNIFINYVRKKNLDKDVTVFTQSGLNAYKEYLIKEKQSNSNINQLCATIVKLINNVLCVNDEFQAYNLRQVKYVKLQDKRHIAEKGSFPLTEDEVVQLANYDGLTKDEKMYKAIFLFQCETGWRVSEIVKVIQGDYENDIQTISVETKKTGERAYCLKTDMIRIMIAYIKKLPKDLINSEKWFLKYDRYLRKIAKKAGLNREIVIKTAKGERKVVKVYEKISSHWARHTKVVLEYKKGTPKEIIAKITGHCDTKMIENVYTKLTDEEREQEFINYYVKNKGSYED